MAWCTLILLIDWLIDWYTIQCVCASKTLRVSSLPPFFLTKCQERELVINPPTSMFASWITSPPSPLPPPLPFSSFTCIECSSLDWRWLVQMWETCEGSYRAYMHETCFLYNLCKFVALQRLCILLYTIPFIIHRLWSTIQLQINHTLHNYIPDKTFACGICPRSTYSELSTN